MERNNGSPYAKLLGIELESVAQGRAVSKMVITEKLLNFLNLAHGGAIFSLADQACAGACNTYGRPAILTHMSISYFHPPAVGDVLSAEAAVINMNRKGGSLEVTVADQDHRIIAKCLGGFLFSSRVYEDFFKPGDTR